MGLVNTRNMAGVLLAQGLLQVYCWHRRCRSRCTAGTGFAARWLFGDRHEYACQFEAVLRLPIWRRRRFTGTPHLLATLKSGRGSGGMPGAATPAPWPPVQAPTPAAPGAAPPAASAPLYRQHAANSSRGGQSQVQRTHGSPLKLHTWVQTPNPCLPARIIADVGQSSLGWGVVPITCA